MITQKVLSGWWLYLAMILIFVSCKNTGPDSDNEITKTVIVKDEDTEETLSGVTFEIQGEIVESNASKLTLTRKKGAMVRVNVSKDGYVSTSGEVNFATDKNNTVVIFMTKDNPDKVDISYEIEDTQGSLIEEAEGYIAGTDTTVGGAEGTFTLPYSNGSVELCGRASYYSITCEELSLDQDHPDVVIVLEETEMVDVSVSVSDEETSEPVDEPTIAVDNYTYESGETTHSFPAHDGTREVFVTAAGYDTTEMDITADESHDLDISLVDLPECSDGINNDGVDGTDEEDPGCVDENGDYDPKDDNEELKGWQRIFAGETTIKEAISGKEGERERAIISKNVSPMPESIQKAVIIRIKVNTLTEESQTGEAWALRLKTGPTDDDLETVYTSDIIEDQGKDGWQTVVFEIPKDAFERGREYEIIAIHATKVRGDPTTDGDDEIIFALPEDGSEHKIVIEWWYEPEEVNDSEKTKLEENQHETLELSPALE